MLDKKTCLDTKWTLYFSFLCYIWHKFRKIVKSAFLCIIISVLKKTFYVFLNMRNEKKFYKNDSNKIWREANIEVYCTSFSSIVRYVFLANKNRRVFPDSIFFSTRLFFCSFFWILFSFSISVLRKWIMFHVFFTKVIVLGWIMGMKLRYMKGIFPLSSIRIICF